MTATGQPPIDDFVPIRYIVHDFDAAIDFYTNQLGITSGTALHPCTPK